MQRREQRKIKSETRKNADVVRMIPLIEIEPHPNNVRRGFDEGNLAELAESIKEQGLLQAILVRSVKVSRTSKTKYQIIAGERRFVPPGLPG
jgi:ParB family chromosome partitioning protein